MNVFAEDVAFGSRRTCHAPPRQSVWVSPRLNQCRISSAAKLSMTFFFHHTAAQFPNWNDQCILINPHARNMLAMQGHYHASVVLRNVSSPTNERYHPKDIIYLCRHFASTRVRTALERWQYTRLHDSVLDYCRHAAASSESPQATDWAGATCATFWRSIGGPILEGVGVAAAAAFGDRVPPSVCKECIQSFA